MKALQRPARVAAVVSAIAAVGAGTMIAVGTASAAEPAKCVENVNVREEPRIDSKVVALCEAGTTVEAGEIRNGFVKLNDLGGWSAQEYISINGQKPVKPGATTDSLEDEEGTRTGRTSQTSEEPTTRSGKPADEGNTTRSGRDATDDTPGGGSTSRTNGTEDETEGSKAEGSKAEGSKAEGSKADAKPKPAPAAPSSPGAGLIPGL